MMTMKGTATAQGEGCRTASDETAQTGGTVQNVETAQTIGMHQERIPMKTGMTIGSAIVATNYHEVNLQIWRDCKVFFLHKF